MASPVAQSSLLSTSLASATSLILLQLLSRATTFGLNQALVRLVSPEVFGTATIQFELLLSTILFLSREGVRNALLRSSSKEKSTSAPSVTNISLLPILCGIPVALLASSTYLYTSTASVRSQSHFQLGVSLYTIAAIIELLSEPLHIRAQNELRFGTRVKAEGTGVILKSVTTLAVLMGWGPEWALPAFAMGQVMYGMSILGTYLGEYGVGTFGSLSPTRCDYLFLAV